jgi:hypothetical protein
VAPNPISSTTVGRPCPFSRNASRWPPTSTRRAPFHPVDICCVSITRPLPSAVHDLRYHPPSVIYQTMEVLIGAVNRLVLCP